MGLVACSWPGEIRATIRFNEAQHRFTVDNIVANGPSARAGLLANDEILAIDGRPVAELTYVQMAELVRGEVGTRVRFRVSRDGSERDIVVERAPIEASR